LILAKFGCHAPVPGGKIAIRYIPVRLPGAQPVNTLQLFENIACFHFFRLRIIALSVPRCFPAIALRSSLGKA
jgi:hypothetical protein